MQKRARSECILLVLVSSPQGYKKFFMLKSAKHKISILHKYNGIAKVSGK